MASSSRQPRTASRKSILTRVMTLEGHEPVAPLIPGGKSKHTKRNCISSICYFPDGKQLISGSDDKTARQWDLQARKEMNEAQDVREQEVCAVGVSRDGRWVVTAEGTFSSQRGELRVCEVETGIVKTFSEGHIGTISIDISLDSTLLASALSDCTVWIKSLKTGDTVVQFPNPSSYSTRSTVGAIRLSQDSKKLAVKSALAQSLEVWDIQAGTCVRVGPVGSSCGIMTNAPMFWTARDKTIITAFSFNASNYTSHRDLETIYEFDALTLKKVGAFKGHTSLVTGLALSFDCALLASAANDFTIKLWAFESRQLLASFDVQHPRCIIFSPDSRQLVYTAWANIHICDISSDILSSILPVQEEEPSTSAGANAAEIPRFKLSVHDPHSYTHFHQTSSLQSNATPPAMRRCKPVISPVRSLASQPPRQSPTIHPLRPTFSRYLRKLLPSSPRMEVPLQNADLRNPLDFPTKLPLPPNSSQASTHGRSQTDPRKNSRLPTNQSSSTATTFKARLHHLWTTRTFPPIFDVRLAPAQLHNDAEDEDYVPRSSNSQPSATGQPTAGEHGSGRMFFCL